MNELDQIRKDISALRAGLSDLSAFVRRIERGDPRLCKPEFANPKYFEKFGED